MSLQNRRGCGQFLMKVTPSSLTANRTGTYQSGNVLSFMWKYSEGLMHPRPQTGWAQSPYLPTCKVSNSLPAQVARNNVENNRQQKLYSFYLDSVSNSVDSADKY